MKNYFEKPCTYLIKFLNSDNEYLFENEDTRADLIDVLNDFIKNYFDDIDNHEVYDFDGDTVRINRLSCPDVSITKKLVIERVPEITIVDI